LLSVEEKYKEMCLRYSKRSGWECREERKKIMDYTGNDQYNT